MCRTPSPPSYLVTGVQSKDDGQHAGGRVATVMLGPLIMNVLKESWVHHQNLLTHRHRVTIVTCLHQTYCLFVILELNTYL